MPTDFYGCRAEWDILESAIAGVTGEDGWLVETVKVWECTLAQKAWRSNTFYFGQWIKNGGDGGYARTSIRYASNLSPLKIY
jgi:hypothetical protein